MDKRYVIRDSVGGRSSALTLEQLRAKVQDGQVGPDTPVSVYPTEFSLPAKDYAEIEDLFVDRDATQLFDYNQKPKPVESEKTEIRLEKVEPPSTPHEPVEPPPPPVESDIVEWVDPEVQQQKTQVFHRPPELIRDGGSSRPSKFGKWGSKKPKRSILVLMLLFLIIYDQFIDPDEDSSQPTPAQIMKPVRPTLPAGGIEKIDPEKSVQIYNLALKPYIQDTVLGYRQAAEGFHLALRYDPQNVKALALLASSYLNLIDSSNKDENTYTVINKLIELSSVKELQLVENLISQVEFLAMSRRYDAGIQKLVDYAKVVGKFDPALYFTLGWLYGQKGEWTNARKYLDLIQANSLPMPKLFYLRGLIFEEGKEFDQAIAEYKRALVLNPQHARSILGLIRIAEKKGEIKQAGRYIDFLNSNPALQSPVEYVHSLIYRSKFALLIQNTDEAISSLEKAIQIDPKNEDLRLEYYSLLSKAGQSSRFKSLAQMYALVLEGERHARAGRTHEATAIFLQAADTFARSEVPFEKLGDLFYQNGEYLKAENNYKKAIETNPKAADIAVKLIDAQIRNHDWDDAQQYLARYRTHPALKSAIDRLAGDLAFHQGNYEAAVGFYRKSMARDTIDTEVYSSYATALRELGQCKDAQFFYSLAQRLDPFNFSAIMGGAQCLLKTDGVDVAVSRLQQELARLPAARPDLVTGIAELYFAAGEDDRALQFARQAQEIDPQYADAYRVEGEIHLKAMRVRRDRKDKALDAFKAYSDRKTSDPSGYLKRFEIYLSDSNFERANEELNRVFEVSPRYPELHYRRARLYIRMGRSKDALAELEEEIKMNPRMVKAWVEQGNIYMRANNLDLANQNFTKAMELNPLDADAKLGAANVAYLKRQFSAAIALYQSALALDRGNPEIYKRLGFAYRDSGDRTKASQAFRSYLDLAPDAPDRREFEQYR